MQTISEHLPAQAQASELDFEDRTYRKVIWRILPVLLLCYMAAYLDRVRQILQDVDEADALVSSQTTELAGVLRILAPPVLATHVLAPLVAGFHERYPSVQLDIEVENHREPQIEQFDITLLGTSAGFDANVIARKINETEAILVASPRYLARRGAPQVPADLLQHDCLRTKPESLRHRHWTLFRADNDRERVELDVVPALWSNHNDTLMRAALDGAGITATAVELAAPHLASGTLVRVLRPWIAGRFTLGTCMSISSMWIGWTPLCSISCLATLALGQNANIGIFGRYAEISRGCTRNIMVNKRSKKDVK